MQLPLQHPLPLLHEKPLLMQPPEPPAPEPPPTPTPPDPPVPLVPPPPVPAALPPPPPLPEGGMHCWVGPQMPEQHCGPDVHEKLFAMQLPVPPPAPEFSSWQNGRFPAAGYALHSRPIAHDVGIWEMLHSARQNPLMHRAFAGHERIGLAPHAWSMATFWSLHAQTPEPSPSCCTHSLVAPPHWPAEFVLHGS